ncbi:holo-ACP synthase [Thiomicrospira microaerophila]|uniref:holo-ACP synthase n=1 Tax=Thiomicrospira microaerophila TaxID=406020 RepID=UPI00200D71DC|nr:holo-ACP synthase [Thiomicrospira microaerophila]UQB43221.1 holo-ACP synthase [Thiomicrospira microaerophila]
MIKGVGTDIVEIERIDALWNKQGMRFAERLLSSTELQHFSNQIRPERFLAKRWAAKEAISKALGTGIAQGVGFLDMTISHSSLGQPLISLTGGALARADFLAISEWHLSISDEKHYAVAFVVAS